MKQHNHKIGLHGKSGNNPTPVDLKKVTNI
jgi:hypothetical protein